MKILEYWKYCKWLNTENGKKLRMKKNSQYKFLFLQIKYFFLKSNYSLFTIEQKYFLFCIWMAENKRKSAGHMHMLSFLGIWFGKKLVGHGFNPYNL